ncbi:MAG: TspO/MBR family protein, partial [Patescibacteria group bacterium]
VWTALYTLMGISLYLISRSKNKQKALKLFFLQLGLNTLWSILFFGLKSPLLALIEIVVLWIMILLTILETKKVSLQPALLLIPYLLWVSFAAVLNLSVVLLN